MIRMVISNVHEIITFALIFVPAVDDIPKLHELERFEQCSLIIRIIDRVAPKWKGVALRLYFEDHCIEVNEMNCHYQAVPACRTMFTRWLEGYGRKPTTWRTLIIALKEENLYTLAEELEKMFQDLLSTTVSNQSSSSEAPAGILLVGMTMCIRVKV